MIVLIRRSSLPMFFVIPILFFLVVVIGRAASFPRAHRGGGAYPTVVIDAGHGAPDGGTTGKTGVEEKDLNLSVAKYTRELLLKEDINVIMTREGDDGIYPAGNKKFSKKADIEERKRIMNTSGADIFVSIHMNSFTDSRYSGAQVFYSRAARGSRELAGILQTKLRQICDVDNKREIKPAESSINVLRAPKIPAVLVECGFLSNQREELLLIDESYQMRLATAITVGIKEFFERFGASAATPQATDEPSGGELSGASAATPQATGKPSGGEPSGASAATPQATGEPSGGEPSGGGSLDNGAPD